MTLPIIAVSHFASGRAGNAITLDGTDEKLSRTASATSAQRRKLTFDFWVYPTTSGAVQPIYTVDNGAFGAKLWITTGDVLRYDETDGSAGDDISCLGSTTIAVSVWTHLHVEYDSTLGTASDRIKFYINGVQDTVSFPGGNTPDSNQPSSFGLNTLVHSIGWDANASAYFAGRLGLMHWIDGLVVSLSTFGETVGSTWMAKLPTGLAYDANGFFLDFASAADLGNDADAGHDFTLTNIDSSNAIGDGPPIAT